MIVEKLKVQDYIVFFMMELVVGFSIFFIFSYTFSHFLSTKGSELSVEGFINNESVFTKEFRQWGVSSYVLSYRKNENSIYFEEVRLKDSVAYNSLSQQLLEERKLIQPVPIKQTLATRCLITLVPREKPEINYIENDELRRGFVTYPILFLDNEIRSSPRVSSEFFYNFEHMIYADKKGVVFNDPEFVLLMKHAFAELANNNDFSCLY
ncbi:hypothetical protein [Motilimonas sp. KMU-193]|uniref:hypothetical protein n=1 Tax=Motilimonas sp. KMU-193 TaxID=3388668 RepID=UPI00396B2A5D